MAGHGGRERPVRRISAESKDAGALRCPCVGLPRRAHERISQYPLPLHRVVDLCNALYGPESTERMHYTVRRAFSLLSIHAVRSTDEFVDEFLPVFILCSVDPIYLSGTSSPAAHTLLRARSRTEVCGHRFGRRGLRRVGSGGDTLTPFPVVLPQLRMSLFESKRSPRVQSVAFVSPRRASTGGMGSPPNAKAALVMEASQSDSRSAGEASTPPAARAQPWMSSTVGRGDDADGVGASDDRGPERENRLEPVLEEAESPEDMLGDGCGARDGVGDGVEGGDEGGGGDGCEGGDDGDVDVRIHDGSFGGGVNGTTGEGEGDAVRAGHRLSEGNEDGVRGADASRVDSAASSPRAPRARQVTSAAAGSRSARAQSPLPVPAHERASSEPPPSGAGGAGAGGGAVAAATAITAVPSSSVAATAARSAPRRPQRGPGSRRSPGRPSAHGGPDRKSVV